MPATPFGAHACAAPSPASDKVTMQDTHLTPEQLKALIHQAFPADPPVQSVGILIDFPDAALPDTPAWQQRREMAANWQEALASSGFTAGLYGYRNVHCNNADLPATAYPLSAGRALPTSAEELERGVRQSFLQVFATHPVFLAPTQLSATAPLKVAAARDGFRAATMPGFTLAMIPALRLDVEEIHSRVVSLCRLLDQATSAHFDFCVAGQHHTLELDLRFHRAHASSGRFLDLGTAGNLPSGEAYVVPYEGDKEGIPSLSHGTMPVQFGEEVVYFHIENNRATRVSGDGPAAAAQRERLQREPAAGNLAELGLGVLAELGVAPIGQVLLDEKLGLHLAFGRSDHFGGAIGAKDFSSPDEVIHIDHVYIPAIQPQITVQQVLLVDKDGRSITLIENDAYAIDFDAQLPS